MARSELRGVVAVDGPSGTGKSTVARRLAAGFGAEYLDTGAMYRAVTLAVLRSAVDLADVDAIVEVAERAELVSGTDPERPTVHLGVEDVAEEIRGPEVTAAVSAVSAVPGVRELLVRHQRRIIDAAVARTGGIVVEGRDIGTTVAPDAGLKVFLTASAEARALRRAAQDSAAGRDASVDVTLADVQRRDRLDSSRAVSPLRRAEDAVEVDTTELDVAGVLRELTALVERRGLRPVPERSRR
ncbi:cytidylate kinase [Streptoalloteichus tenebrarius]|uniref:Cytidylate kinase n=1 Tax=Streptoalloteichus tenebrarius (strain ATCC 17920 / DSM 40477 / JCM 4838 / CBS 697.72 / NBRC 16177 / NCIMB 11028 / NRRL B-12390 / A12253. 1 / ISP 5477) TaxID=1933 RepID=A0ABT1I0K9_STRSD|nr:(d)CMP kinase [Streptoalloteichus tenebrarius]MCP2261304.1 cytidylate kinase [Streptoalloteichus tenebrarius]BFF03703.1 (d)CMP kinase [Streptoalloteichus tenebrarius]